MSINLIFDWLSLIYSKSFMLTSKNYLTLLNEL